jgi:DNA-binding transcriptional LysR family regulator
MITPHEHHESGAFVTTSTLRLRNPINLATLDLNLLRVFDALQEERSVTRAGLRLGLTQSAVSHALHRLREVLGDDLFNRTPEGMTPTIRAREIGPRLRAALVGLQDALIDTTFDPAEAENRFSIAADPHARFLLLPQVIARLRRLAPSIELRVKPGVAGVTDALDSNRLDLVIASYRRIPDRFASQDLLHERLVWALRTDHPAAQAPLTLETLARLPRLMRLVSDDDDDGDHDLPTAGRGLERRAIPDDDGALNRALAGVADRHTVRLTIPDNTTAMAVVGQSDLVALVTERLGRQFAPHFGLALFDPPYESPTIPISMVWHRSHGANPAAEWLRGLIATVAAEL